MKDKVSIIIPTYNGTKTIDKTLESVLTQKYTCYEIIVVDDGSTDGTIDHIKKNYTFVKLIQQKNQGTLAARQAGLDVSDGNFIVFLDQDDILLEETLERAVVILQQQPHTGLILANMKAIDDAGSPLSFDVVPEHKCYTPSWEELILFHPIANSVAMFRREVIKKIGGLDSSFGFSGALGDTDTFSRMSEVTNVHFINEYWGYYRWSETRPGRLISFLTNLRIYAKKYWEHPRLQGNETLREKFAQTCCNYGVHIYRLLLRQYDDEISFEILEKLNEHNKYMQSVFGSIYQSHIGLRSLDLTLFNLEKDSTRTLLFIYLLRKDLQDTFSSVFKGSLDELKIWANEVSNQKYIDGDFSSLQKYVHDFSYETPKLSSQKRWAIFCMTIAQKKNHIRQKIAATIHRALPEGTIRRQFLYPFVLGIKIFFYEGWRSFLKKTWNYFFTRLKPTINLTRNKISLVKEFLLFNLNPQKKIIFPLTNSPIVAIFVSLSENRRNNYRCLKSIWSHSKIPYEVFAITSHMSSLTISNVKNIVIIKHPRKITSKIELYKLIRKRISHQKYVLFLDGDCIVTDGYLESMLSLLNKDKCDVVSGKIVDLYGQVALYAGGSVLPDGKLMICGYGDQPDQPEYSYVRSVDMIAEECIMTQKDILDTLCENNHTDYKATMNSLLQKNGYKMLYQPMAIIKYQDIKKFRAIHIDELKNADRPKQNNLNKLNHAPRVKILVLDDYIPAIRYGSGFPRLYEMLSCLSKLGYSVTFFPVGNPVKVQPETRKLQEEGIEIFWEEYASFESLVTKRHNYYDIVLISRPHVFENFHNVVRKGFPDAVVLYDAEALFYTREQAKAKLSSDIKDKKIAKLAKQEMNLLEKADLVISVSTREQEVMLQQSSQPNIEVWGHIQDVKPLVTSFEERNGILFLGSFFAGSGSPNEDAAIYFAKDVFPKVLEKMDCKLYIVGANPTDAVKALVSEKIEVTGYVEDLDHYFHNCKINIVPTRFAAGIPLKLLQAMGYGIPTVVSELIARQLELSDNRQVLVARDSEEFVEKIVLLYSQQPLWNTISQNSQKFIQDNFSRLPMQKKINAIIQRSLAIKEQRLATSIDQQTTDTSHK